MCASSAPAAHAALVPARRRLLLALSVAGLLLLLAALASTALQLVRYGSGDAQPPVVERAEAREAVLRAGAQSALNLTSIDNEVVAEGTVIETGLVQLEARSATALVVVDSNVRNTAGPQGRVNTYRMKLQLELRNGRGLTSKLEFMG